MNNKYKPVIGLEVHVELKTESKMFCGCSADYFGQKPNTHTCPVCLGLPGALPVPNKKAIEWCVMIGQALNCKISSFSKFDRKNYFYPDLPKGYQISQYDQPFCEKGWIDVKSEIRNPKSETNSKSEIQNSKRIGITRVHMEEDTGKLIHEGDSTLIDFNRSGVPLVEIVTDPDFETATEVKEYLQKLQQIVRYLGVSNADMEKGDMRLEPNISVKTCHSEFISESQNLTAGKARILKQVQDDILPSYKVEVKNINSFKFVEKAIDYEIKRHIEILKKGETPAQETRGWDEKKQITVSQRSKEEAKDYRYFPEPDIPPIRFTDSQIENIQSQMPELPDEKFNRFKKEYGLPEYDAEILTREKETAEYFEEAIRASREVSGIKYQVSSKTIANYIINKRVDIDITLPAQLIQQIIQSSQIATVDENELEKIIDHVLSENPKAVEDYKKGKENVIMFLIGQVIKIAKRKIETKMIKNKILEKIK